MLAGEAVIATWNGITPEGRDDFYAWHIQEHIPERVGIPGFRRGRRYIGVTPDTHPEFFTLYEADTMQVLQGVDYANRLNAPTPWTKSATVHFRDTARALARVLASEGPGMGGFLLTVRFDVGASEAPQLADLVRQAARQPRVVGAHFCVADDAASSARTAESKDRADIQAPPTWFVMIEATDADALTSLLPDSALAGSGACGRFDRGLYRLEYVRTKTAFT